MGKLTRSSRSGARAVDMSEVMAAVKGGLPGAQLAYGVVTKFQGETAHYEVDSQHGQVLVTVLIQPNALMVEATPLVCVLATSAAGPGTGIWKIPAVGTEVVVAIPGGELEADPVIVATTGSGTMPSGLDATSMVIVNPDGTITVKAKGDVSVQSTQGDVSVVSDTGNISISSTTGSVTVKGPAGTGSVKLGTDSAALTPLAFGSIDSMGVPVTNNPLMALSIVKVG